MLPRLAENPANKVLVVPTDYAGLAGLATALSNLGADGVKQTGDGAGTSPSRVSARMPAGAPQALLQGEQPATDKP
jgi:hypothetical protein